MVSLLDVLVSLLVVLVSLLGVWVALPDVVASSVSGAGVRVVVGVVVDALCNTVCGSVDVDGESIEHACATASGDEA